MTERNVVPATVLVATAVALAVFATWQLPALREPADPFPAAAGLAAALLALAGLWRWRWARSSAAPEAGGPAGPPAAQPPQEREDAVPVDPPAAAVPPREEADTASGHVASLAAGLRALADRLEELASGASARADEGREHAAAVAAAVEELSTAIAVIGENGVRSAQASEEVVGESRRLAEALAVLAAGADAIEGIVETVREVAEKTRILALNAAIEAARVGEAGRGFAVVAGEVKALARRTAEATAGIDERITAMRKALAQVERVAATLDSGARTASEAAAAIAAAVEEQSAAAAEISERVRAIATGSEDLAALLGGGTAERSGLLALARELEQDAEELEAAAFRAAGRARKDVEVPA